MPTDQLSIGDDVFVRDPKRFVPDATNITGRVQGVSDLGALGRSYTIAAFIGKMGGYDNPSEGQPMLFSERDLGFRHGTPLSQLSGRPGHRGYDEFKSIAASWGYD